MTLLWNTPRIWENNEPITKEKLNSISNGLTYLYNPSRASAINRGTGTDATITSTTLVEIDDSIFLLQLELAGDRDCRIKFDATVNNNTLAAVSFVDVSIDGTTWVSSLTGTAVTTHLWLQEQYVAGNRMHVTVDTIIPAGVLTPGLHTFAPRARVSAGTLTVRLLNHFAQFIVGEF